MDSSPEAIVGNQAGGAAVAGRLLALQPGGALLGLGGRSTVLSASLGEAD